MIKRRRRFKQTVSFRERLKSFAEDLRAEAAARQPGPERDELLKRVRGADTALQFEELVRSPGLQPSPAFAKMVPLGRKDTEP